MNLTTVLGGYVVMNNYDESKVREYDYLGVTSQKDEVLESYVEDIKSMALIARTSKSIRTTHRMTSTRVRAGKVIVYNLYNRIMTADEFMRLTDKEKLITIEEYKVRHGLGKASVEMGKNKGWLSRQKFSILKRMEKEGIDGKKIIVNHKNKMKINEIEIVDKNIKKVSKSKNVKTPVSDKKVVVYK